MFILDYPGGALNVITSVLISGGRGIFDYRDRRKGDGKMKQKEI